jgi:hypothetical protein
MIANAVWTVDLTEPAEADFAAIIPWTAEQSGCGAGSGAPSSAVV